METKRRSGRPKKADHEKVQYQLIAVYFKDYVRLGELIKKKNESLEKENRLKLSGVFTEMVDDYAKK
jgi:hypothetical protein